MSIDFSLLNNGRDGGFIIGKGTVMYTLYKYEYRKIEDAFNESCKYVFNAHWVKNISKDLNVVKESYPYALIDEELHGRLYYSETDNNGGEHLLSAPREYDYKRVKFPFGKYIDTMICDCNDASYLCWCLNPKIAYDYQGCPYEKYVLDNSRNEFQILACIDRLKELGGCCFLGRYVTKEIKDSEAFAIASRFIENGRGGNPLVISVDKDIDWLGYVYNLLGFNISVWFNNCVGDGEFASKCVSNRYCSYGMLKFNDGKFHKAKGHTVTIHNYDFVLMDDGSYEVKVMKSSDYEVA